MIIFDAHLDLAWNAIDWNRDLRLPVEKIRQLETEAGLQDKGRCCNTVAFPDLRRGKVVLFIATLLARLLRIGAMPAIQRYSSMTAAYGAAHGQLAYYRGLEQEGLLRFIKDWPALESHLKAWQNDENSGTLPLGYILSMEGADPVLRPDQVEEWYQAGLRIIGPTHYGLSPYGHGTGTEGGFFPPGRPLLKEMERVGMILDVTHLSDQCFDEALESYGGPLLASHHNNRTLVPNQRQLTDDQTRRLIGRKAVIGIALDSWMLHPGWIRGESKPELVKLERMIDHIDRVCELAGNANHVAIGTDLDGGYGREQSPCDLDTIADLQKIPDLLRRRGYQEADIKGIMHGNWVRFFKRSLDKEIAGPIIMGLDRKVTLPPDIVPAWNRLVDFCAARKFPVKMMMIDGALSFPDEQPPDSWLELRVGTPLGMVTMRRESDGVRLVTWGNADGPMRQAWNALTYALAITYDGIIQDVEGNVSPADFSRKAELPEGFGS